MIRAALALSLLLLAAPRGAHADAKTEAQVHLDRATELHEQGKFADVLTELTTAYALDPQPDLLYAIAQTEVALGDCPRAIIFYQRFLSTRPARMAADAAREAIDVCEHAPPPPPPAPEPAPPPPPVVEVAPPPPPPPPRIEHRPGRSWYRDPIGMSLVVGGVGLGVGAGVSYGLALRDLDDADVAPTYAAYVDLVDRGHQQRLYAGVMGGASVVLTVIGVYRLWRYHRPAADLAIVPTTGGGVVSWAGRF